MPAGHSTTLVLGTGLAALLLAVPAWPVTKHAITAAHEGGHALMAFITGGKVSSVTLKPDGTGQTGVSTGTLGGILAALAGYLGPSLFGLFGVLLLGGGRPVIVLWVSLVFLALLLLQIRLRDLFGVVVVVLTGGLMFVTVRYAGDSVRTPVAYGWTWFLLIGGVRHVLAHIGSAADATALKKMTRIPALLWRWLFLVVTSVALLWGGGVLLGIVSLKR